MAALAEVLGPMSEIFEMSSGHQAMFLKYLAMGAHRSLATLAAEEEVKESSIRGSFERYHWKKNAQKFDKIVGMELANDYYRAVKSTKRRLAAGLMRYVDNGSKAMLEDNLTPATITELGQAVLLLGELMGDPETQPDEQIVNQMVEDGDFVEILEMVVEPDVLKQIGVDGDEE